MIENGPMTDLRGNSNVFEIESEDSKANSVQLDMDESSANFESSPHFDFGNSTQTSTPTPSSESPVAYKFAPKSRKRKAVNKPDPVNDAFINSIQSISNTLLKEKDEDDEDLLFVKSVAQQMKKMTEDIKVNFKVNMLFSAYEAVRNSCALNTEK